MSEGLLAICATPIGNLSDISERVIMQLKESDAVYAEDTRVTRKLFSKFDIKTKLFRCDENVTDKVAPEIVSKIKDGMKIALVSDAGMPCISDPGQRVVSSVREAGLKVTVLPGPNAALTALAGSGFICKSYYFGGFMPRKKGERLRLLKSLSGLDSVLIFYESNHRVVSSLCEIAEVFPDRRVCMARELTKLYEEYLIDFPGVLLDDLKDREDSLKGEVVLVIEAAEVNVKFEADEPQASEEKIKQRAKELSVQDGMKPSKIARHLTAEFGIDKDLAYKIATL